MNVLPFSPREKGPGDEGEQSPASPAFRSRVVAVLERLVLAMFVTAFGVSAFACGGSSGVARVLSGELVDGRVIESDAYAAFLRGAIAEAEGNFALAAFQYQRAVTLDGRSAESWARLGIAACRARASEGGERAAARALEIDRENATAFEARAFCRESAGDGEGGRGAMARAVALEPRDAALVGALADRDLKIGRPDLARARLEGWLLEPHTDPGLRMAAAELALHGGDVARACELASVAVALTPFQARTAARLAAEMSVTSPLFARKLAASVVDLAPIGAGGTGRVATTLANEPLVPLLAIEDALLRDDVDKALARAAKGGVTLGEVFGRAALLGKLEAARRILPLLEVSSPHQGAAARLVLDVAPHGVPTVEPTAGDLPPALEVALLERMTQVLDPESARLAIDSLAVPKVDPRDRLLRRPDRPPHFVR